MLINCNTDALATDALAAVFPFPKLRDAAIAAVEMGKWWTVSISHKLKMFSFLAALARLGDASVPDRPHKPSFLASNM